MEREKNPLKESKENKNQNLFLKLTRDKRVPFLERETQLEAERNPQEGFLIKQSSNRILVLY